MTINEIRRALKIGLIVVGIYILLSLITGALLVARDIAPFGVGFLATAVWAASLAWLIKLARD